MRRRADWIGLLVAWGAAAGCARLGVWQVHRLAQRRARNAAVAAVLAGAPDTLAPAAAGPHQAGIPRMRLRAKGVYDYGHERIWGGRAFQGVPGVAVITPLRISPTLAVLVDRGFVASQDARHIDLSRWREPDSADVVGLAFDAPRGRGDADPAALRDSFPYQLAPFILQLQASDSLHPERPEPNGLHRWPGPDLSDGPHLSYAIQWFSFAVIIVVGSVILFRRESMR
ncbi:MAG TPA: SURF1 family protein [Gemmatimonadales bacterium]